jgi:superoxide dismutase, Cu-Zn family
MATRAGKNRRTRLAAAGAAGAAALGGLAIALASAGPAAGDGWEARAVLRDASGVRVGTVRFEGDARGTTVKVVVHGIKTGTDTYHGLHIHANDNREACVAPAFTNVLGHWTSPGVPHGHHKGDLPSVLVQADGTGSGTSVTGRFDPGELAGKAVILHAGPDNFANVPNRYATATGIPPVGPDATTLATGDSGGRIACGIIARD